MAHLLDMFDGRRCCAWLALPMLLAAGPGRAQDNVVLYGLADLGLVREVGGQAGAVNKVTSGVASQSRLGLRGDENLGGGWSLLFDLETGVAMDTGNLTAPGTLLFGRNAYVGFSNGGNSVIAGRFFTPYYQTLSFADPFGTGMAGAASNLMSTTGLRFSNAVRLTSAPWRGWSGELAWSLGEVAGDARAGNAFGATLGYTDKVLGVRLSHHSRNNDTALLHGQHRALNTLLGATADFHWIKLHGALAWNSGKGSAPQGLANPYGDAQPAPDSQHGREMLAGVSMPTPLGRLLLSAIRKDDRESRNADARQLAVGLVHGLSKRTEIYAAYASMRHDNGARYTVGNQSGDPGSGDRAFNLGMRHSF
jgi:predicted porin